MHSFVFTRKFIGFFYNSFFSQEFCAGWRVVCLIFRMIYACDAVSFNRFTHWFAMGLPLIAYLIHYE